MDNTEKYEDLIVAIYHQASVDLARNLVYGRDTTEAESFLTSEAYGIGKSYGEYIIDNIYKTYYHFKPLFDDLSDDSTDTSVITFLMEKWNMDVIRTLKRVYHCNIRITWGTFVNNRYHLKDKVIIERSRKHEQ